MQDVIFNLNAMNFARMAEYKEMYGYHYRINNNSVCVKYNPRIFDTFLQVIDEFEKFIKNYNKDESYYQALYMKIILMYIEGCRISILHKDNNDKFCEKIKKLKTIYNTNSIKKAFNEIKYENLNLKLKLFVFMANIKSFCSIYLMIKIFMATKLKEQQ